MDVDGGCVELPPPQAVSKLVTSTVLSKVRCIRIELLPDVSLTTASVAEVPHSAQTKTGKGLVNLSAQSGADVRRKYTSSNNRFRPKAVSRA